MGGCFEENLVKLVQLVFHICGFLIHGLVVHQKFWKKLHPCWHSWMVQCVDCLHWFKCYRRSRHDFHVQEIVYSFIQHYTIKRVWAPIDFLSRKRSGVFTTRGQISGCSLLLWNIVVSDRSSVLVTFVCFPRSVAPVEESVLISLVMNQWAVFVCWRGGIG